MKQHETPSRRAATERQKSHGESLRAWLQGRVAALAKRRERARKKDAKKRKRESRGIDRVPERYRGPSKPIPKVVVEHHDDNYETRRLFAKARGQRDHRGRLTVRSGANQPYVNPKRDDKPGARLRKDLAS